MRKALTSSKLGSKRSGANLKQRMFPQTIIHKISETGCKFLVAWCTAGGIQVLVFKSFLLVLTKFLFLAAGQSTRLSLYGV